MIGRCRQDPALHRSVACQSPRPCMTQKYRGRAGLDRCKDENCTFSIPGRTAGTPSAWSAQRAASSSPDRYSCPVRPGLADADADAARLGEVDRARTAASFAAESRPPQRMRSAALPLADALEASRRTAGRRRCGRSSGRRRPPSPRRSRARRRAATAQRREDRGADRRSPEGSPAARSSSRSAQALPSRTSTPPTMFLFCSIAKTAPLSQ